MVGQTNKTVYYGYDNNGNQTSCSDAGTVNEYDEFNQLIKTTITVVLLLRIYIMQKATG